MADGEQPGRLLAANQAVSALLRGPRLAALAVAEPAQAVAVALAVLRQLATPKRLPYLPTTARIVLDPDGLGPRVEEQARTLLYACGAAAPERRCLAPLSAMDLRRARLRPDVYGRLLHSIGRVRLAA